MLNKYKALKKRINEKHRIFCCRFIIFSASPLSSAAAEGAAAAGIINKLASVLGKQHQAESEVSINFSPIVSICRRSLLVHTKEYHFLIRHKHQINMIQVH